MAAKPSQVHLPIPLLSSDPNALTMSSENNVANCLRAALRMPAAQRWVADWLFADLPQTPFHKNLPLPPHALQNALALHAQHNISIPASIFAASNAGQQQPCAQQQPQQPQPQQHRYQRNQQPQQQPPNFVTTKVVDLIFVPVASMDSTIVGYSLGLGPRNRAPLRDAIPSNPFNTPFAARFAFDTSVHDLLLVTHGATPPVIGIIAMSWSRERTRDQFTFAVPSDEYSFDKLPSTVLSMFSNIEHRFEDLPFAARAMLSNEDDLHLPSDDRPSAHAPPDPPRPEPTRQVYQEESSTESPSGSTSSTDGFLDERPPDSSLLFNELLGPELLGTVPLKTAGSNSPVLQPDLIEKLLGPDAQSNVPDSNVSAWGQLQTPPAPQGAERGSRKDSQLHALTPTTHLPWIVGSDGSAADGLAISPKPADESTSSGAFAMGRLERALTTLADQLRGRFYGPTVRMDSLHILTGRYTSMYTGKITYAVRNLDLRAITFLKEAFAHEYYQAVLAVGPDQRLVTPFQEEVANAEHKVNGMHALEGLQHHVENAELQEESEDGPVEMFVGAVPRTLTHVNGVRYGQNIGIASPMSGVVAGGMKPPPVLPIILPRTSTMTTSSSNPYCGGTTDDGEKLVYIAPAARAEADKSAAESSATIAKKAEQKVESKEERKARMEAERRKRNRLSAARSNLRKKLELEAVRKEIESNRQRMVELGERHRLAVTENERLRRMVAERAGLVGR